MSNKFIHQCAGKVKHATLIGAQYALECNAQQHKNAEIYVCGSCGFFHIGTYSKLKMPYPKKHKPKEKEAWRNQKPKIRKFKK